MSEKKMRKIVFNTAFEKLSVSVLDGGGPLYHCEYFEKRKNAVNIDKIIENAMAVCCVDFSDITDIYVFCGPGSFTGIKLGLSLTYGLMCGMGEKVKPKGLSLLDYILFNAAVNSGVKCEISAAIPGVRGEYFCKTLGAGDRNVEVPGFFNGVSEEFVALSEKLKDGFECMAADPISRQLFDDPAATGKKLLKVEYSAQGIFNFIRYCEKYDNSRFLELSPIYLKDTYAVKPGTVIA